MRCMEFFNQINNPQNFCPDKIIIFTSRQGSITIMDTSQN